MDKRYAIAPPIKDVKWETEFCQPGNKKDFERKKIEGIKSA